ncbi:hypothetical protein BJ166DRAFT_586830 [Pestalotiopsis sp. NC0098]|nr:hypothetical protein BJ166DRAFT_586830 [Pestalotiopsis sp. NC0098]
MKSFFALAVALAASMASAGVIITPIKANQVVAKNDGDCFFGVTTPNGCGVTEQTSKVITSSPHSLDTHPPRISDPAKTEQINDIIASD